MIYPVLGFDSKNMFFKIFLTKKILNSVSTRNDRCEALPQITCLMRLMYQEILARYGCESYYVTNGTYLNDLKKPNVTFCNKSEHQDIRKNLYESGYFAQLHHSCTKACIQSMYSMLPQTFMHPNSNSTVEIVYGDPNVEVNKHTISYEIQSLIGEVGGTLGLTLGLSGFSISAIMLSFLRKIF